jgi:predicted exporter
VNIRLIILVTLIVGILTAIAFYRIRIDTDIVSSIPHSDPVIADARHILLNHPIHDRVVVDLSVSPHDPAILADGAEQIEHMLGESRLFQSVGTKKMGAIIPELIARVSDHLPVLFSEEELHNAIQPLIEPAHIHEILESQISQLQTIESIGQAKLVSKDPLGFRGIVLAKLSGLAPSGGASKNQIGPGGQIVSADGRHLLIVAKPLHSGSDTAYARKLTQAIQDASAAVNQTYGAKGYIFTLTPAGAFRAALDNEEYARADVQNSLLWSTVGIALLMLFTFPRPLIGLMSFIPAFVATLLAFFVFSLFHKTISIMTLGFGGAVISITVDQGIAYLLFLDQKHETRGKEAASEVWGIGVLATLTTVIAFLMLSFSGFPILAEIGQFATFGGIFSFLFVHTVFPKIFPVMPPAKTNRALPVHLLINRFARSDNKKAWAAVGFALIMLAFAKPDFRADLSAMNTISEETRAADKLLASVWGDIFSKIYLLIEGTDMDELRKKADRAAGMIEEEIRSGALSSAFVPSMVLPGEERARQNLRAWRRFWDLPKKTAVKDTLRIVGSDLGFAQNAFEPFFALLDQTEGVAPAIGPEYFDLMGISQTPQNTPLNPPSGGEYRADVKQVMFCTLTPGTRYDAPEFYAKFSGVATIFDPNWFSVRLGRLLSSTFVRMAVIVGISTVVMLFLVFFNWRLTAVVLIPTMFAFVCTLGTLKLLGRPVDIPGIMLSIVILGMGVDYSICFVHSYQRYHDEMHPSFALIRVAVFLTAVSAMIGFGVLSVSNHLLLRSAGLVSALGVGYSLIGTFVLLPPLMKGKLRRFLGSESGASSPRHRRRLIRIWPKW